MVERIDSVRTGLIEMDGRPDTDAPKEDTTIFLEQNIDNI